MASNIADRNLLFGVLALQMEFVTQEQVVAALDAWGHFKEKTLGDILVEQSVLDSERRQLLNAVLAQRLKQHGGDAAHSLAALAVPPALRNELSRFTDPELQASVSRTPAPTPQADPYATNYGVGGVKTQPEIHLPPDPYSANVGRAVGATHPEPPKAADPYATNLPSVGGVGGKTRPESQGGGAAAAPSGPEAGAAAPYGSRFRVLRPLARGGLGEVMVAEDEELNREVALKQIQAHHADDVESRARFVAEAEFTGKLEHPGIVPVYGLGKYRDGRPYYAMRFIRGDSLKEKIDQFHKADSATRDPGERNLQLRHLLERFVDVCEAIAYAHSRGVLHRDLKPGNIMLGKYGETLVVDWGLAKTIGENEPIPENPDQRRVTLSGTAAATPTLMGAAVGTPQFMSPEQAAGELDKLGPASDVYSLGATMYALLTGSVPIIDRDLVNLLQRVQKGDFPPPRTIKPNIPRALEAMCLKAMALKPADRYPGPKELSADIERWLGDEPVKAFPEPWTARAARFMRKNPAAVAACIVAVPLLFMIAVVLNIYKARETKAKEEAQDNYRLARKAVDDYDTNVSESVLLNEPGMQPLRKKLLDDAQKFYVEFVRKYKDDPTVKGELGRAKYRLGQIVGDIENEQKAIVLLQEAADIFAVDKSVDQSEVARCYHHLGRLYMATDDFEKSQSWYQKALAIWESLGGAGEEQLAGWARSQFGLGNVLQRKRQFEQARAEYSKALATLAKLAERNLAETKPNTPEHLRDKGVIHRNLGRVFAALEDQQKAAAAEFAKAIALQEKLTKEHPNLSKFQDDLAASHYTLGDVQLNAKQYANSIASFQTAAKIWEKLTQSHPAVLDYHARLADAYAAIAEVLIADGKADQAVKASDQALEVQRKLTDKSRELAEKNEAAPKYRGLLAQRHVGHADVLRRAGQGKAAESAYEDALKIQMQLTVDVPKTPDYQADLARMYNGRGLLRKNQEQYELAEKDLMQALAIWEKLQKDYPESVEFAQGVAATLINLRALMRSPGVIRIALAPLDRIIGIYESHALIQQQPVLRQALLGAYWTRAEARTAHALFSEAMLDWDRAQNLAADKNDKILVRIYRAVTLARYQQSDEATREAEALTKEIGEVAEARYELARIFALSAKAEAKKNGEGAEQAKKRLEQYSERAIEFLHEAQELGYFNRADRRQHMAHETDWEILRGRESFQTWLRNLSKSKGTTP